MQHTPAVPQPSFRNKKVGKKLGKSLEKAWEKLGESLEKRFMWYGSLFLQSRPAALAPHCRRGTLPLPLRPGSRLLCPLYHSSLPHHHFRCSGFGLPEERSRSIDRSLVAPFSSSAAGGGLGIGFRKLAACSVRSWVGSWVREEADMAVVRGGGLMLVAMAAMVLAMTAAGAKAAPMEYVVKWDFPTTERYYSATQGRTYKVGDKLKFVYMQEMHNVVKVGSVSDFTQCTTSTALSPEYADGQTSLTLDHAGAHYFICSIPGHCADGMKIKVLAQA